MNQETKDYIVMQITLLEDMKVNAINKEELQELIDNYKKVLTNESK